MTEIGRILEIVRYPVKSMAGIVAESAFLGWHGLDGDRRFAFRRVGDNSGMPWLTASRLPQLLLYRALESEETTGESHPVFVRTPNGAEFSLGSAELAAEISGQIGGPVELMHLRHGIFDETPVSVI
ncbi:MAG TPA: MOSC N-terminal beta barrel domain-containing protein, partial [Bacteroidota bacterium]|nr:MOSC N-terminal beta barrel domain-containing protein [Bacteroidota bacterium]